MSSPANSRSLILDRIRTAVTPPPTDRALPNPRKYVRHGQLSVQSRLHLMVSRLREYDADVLECAPEHLIAAIADRLQLSKRLQFVVPPQVPTAWQVPGLDWKVDNGMSYEEIEQCEGVITTAFAGIADSGTIVLHHSPPEGRRVVSLLPDWHLCILRARQVVETLPEYFDLCSTPPELATFISGPSATSDIEMTRIKGVHGPRFLNVILVHDENQVDTAANQGRSQ